MPPSIGDVTRSAAPSTDAGLPTKTHFLDTLTSETCPICYENLTDPIKTACDHSFCLECAKTWFRDSNTCPYCRTVLYEQEESAESVVEEVMPRRDDLFRRTLRSLPIFVNGRQPLLRVIFALDHCIRRNLATDPAFPIFSEEETINKLQEMSRTGDGFRLKDRQVYSLRERVGAFQWAMQVYICTHNARQRLFGHLVDFAEVVDAANRFLFGGHDQFNSWEAYQMLAKMWLTGHRIELRGNGNDIQVFFIGSEVRSYPILVR